MSPGCLSPWIPNWQIEAMHYFILLSVLIVGASGIIAQGLLLRELLVSFYGNELVLGLILANWLLAEAAGVFAAGKFPGKPGHKTGRFIALEVFFSFLFPLALFFCRTFKPLLGISFAEAAALPQVFLVSLCVMFPVGFLHGALFNSCLKLYAAGRAGYSVQAIGRVYAWEIIGTILGALVFTYLFIPYFNSFVIVFFVSLLNLSVAAVFAMFNPAKRLLNICLIGLAVGVFVWIEPDSLHRLSVCKQWQGQKVLAYRNSVYGNIVVTKQLEQNTFFYNGVPVVTVPYPDVTFVQEFGNMPLLFHPCPRDALIISAGAGGLLSQVEGHSLQKIYYAELDPLFIAMLKQYPAGLINKEFSDARLRIINADGRLFLMKTKDKFDIILVGLSKPSDLSVNRIFSEEFFNIAKQKLAKNGIIAISLPGSLTYISTELRDLNAEVINALRAAFTDIRIIPGDYNMILASNSSGLLQVDTHILAERMRDRGIKAGLLTSAYLAYRLDKTRLEWFKESMVSATKKINRDFAPVAVFEMLIYWNKQFSPAIAGLLQAAGSFNMPLIFVAVTLLTVALLFFPSHKHKIKIGYAIATTGFFGMLMSLVLIFSFQVFYGYLYYMIGMLIALFMAGAAGGSILLTRYLGRLKNMLTALMLVDFIMFIFCGVMIMVLAKITYFSWSYPLLFSFAGALVGAEFPLAAAIYPDKEDTLGETAGVLYAADLIGGWLAGMLGGVLLLPVLGLFQTCLVMALLKLSSVILLSQNRK